MLQSIEVPWLQCYKLCYIINYLTVLLEKRTTNILRRTLSTDVPVVVLRLGSKLNPEDIEEGDDVYFECVVQANPPAYKVIWEHNVSYLGMVFWEAQTDEHS